MNVWKPLEWALVGGARLAWPAFQAINRRVEGQPFLPKWAPAPFPKSRDRRTPIGVNRPKKATPRIILVFIAPMTCPTCIHPL